MEYEISQHVADDLESLKGDPYLIHPIALVLSLRKEIANAYKQGILDGISAQRIDLVHVEQIANEHNEVEGIGGEK